MAPRKVILLLFAAVIALLTIVAVRNGMTPDKGVAAQQDVLPTTEIAVATRDLPTGTILKASDLKWVQWSSNADTTALIVKGKDTLESASGAVIRDGFKSGEPIIAARVVHPNDQGFLAAVLNPGMRAMSLSLKPEAEVAGFVFPGDRVDVILTHSFSRRDSQTLTERKISETVLRDVRVLALDQRSDNHSKDPKVAQMATLEIDPKQAEKLALAVDMASGNGPNRGSLSLVLRSLASEEQGAGDKGVYPTWDSDVSSAYPNVNGEDGLMHRIQVMRGKTVTENIFERHR